MHDLKWPYPLEWEKEEIINTDILVLGGGISGCMAAISAATNPCSRISPEELTMAMLDDNDGFNNGISHYIECREGYDRLLEVFDILTVSQIIIHSCLARKNSSKALCFNRDDGNGSDEKEKDLLITVKQVKNNVIRGERDKAFFGDLKANYEKFNRGRDAGLKSHYH